MGLLKTPPPMSHNKQSANTATRGSVLLISLIMAYNNGIIPCHSRMDVDCHDIASVSCA